MSGDAQKHREKIWSLQSRLPEPGLSTEALNEIASEIRNLKHHLVKEHGDLMYKFDVENQR